MFNARPGIRKPFPPLISESQKTDASSCDRIITIIAVIVASPPEDLTAIGVSLRSLCTWWANG